MRRRPRWARWIGLGAAVGAMGVLPVAARTQRTPAPPPRTVVVQYGDSIWTLARRYGDPHRDVRAVVAAIGRANRVKAAELQPGQRLLIPAEYLR